MGRFSVGFQKPCSGWLFPLSELFLDFDRSGSGVCLSLCWWCSTAPLKVVCSAFWLRWLPESYCHGLGCYRDLPGGENSWLTQVQISECKNIAVNSRNWSRASWLVSKGITDRTRIKWHVFPVELNETSVHCSCSAEIRMLCFVAYTERSAVEGGPKSTARTKCSFGTLCLENRTLQFSDGEAFTKWEYLNTDVIRLGSCMATVSSQLFCFLVMWKGIQSLPILPMLFSLEKTY